MADYFGNDYFGEYFSDGYFGPQQETNPGAMTASLSGAGAVAAEIDSVRRALTGDGGRRRGSSARAIHSSTLRRVQEPEPIKVASNVIEYRPKPPVAAIVHDDDEEALMLLMSA